MIALLIAMCIVVGDNVMPLSHSSGFIECVGPEQEKYHSRDDWNGVDGYDRLHPQTSGDPKSCSY